MKIKIDKVGNGAHPNELLVAVRTASGEERLFVHNRSIRENNTLEIGYPIQEIDGQYLVELPRETLNGSWRVWVAMEMIAA